jgi:hypothetical protein
MCGEETGGVSSVECQYIMLKHGIQEIQEIALHTFVIMAQGAEAEGSRL